MSILCALALPMLFNKTGYTKQGEMSDSKSIAIYANKAAEGDVQHVILYASLDPLANNLALIRGFTDTGGTCKIGDYEAKILMARRDSPVT